MISFSRDPLKFVLSLAYHQAMKGKGKERHADDQPFLCQAWHSITRAVGVGFPTGQALKKMQESQRLPKEAAIKELLGAIVYLCMAIIAIMEEKP